MKSAEDVGRKEVELDDGVELFSMNCGEDSGKDSAFVTGADGLWLTFPRSFNRHLKIDPSWWMSWILCKFAVRVELVARTRIHVVAT